MKYIILITLIIFTISCNKTEEDSHSKYNSSIPQKNIIILDASSFRDSSWVPSVNDVNTTIKQIENFLSNPHQMNSYDSIAAKKIYSRFNLYAVQLSGEYRNGKKIIWCNFFPETDLRFINYDLKNTPHIVEDGGSAYWQISYDIIDKKLFNFFVNGEA